MYYKQKYIESIETLKSNINGLSSDEAKKRLEEHGYNELKEGVKVPTWKLFLESFKDPLVIILLIAALVQIFLGEVVEYNITMKFDGLSKNRRINGSKIIDVLPEGITYVSYYIHKQEQKNMLKKEPYVIDDYNGSGR